MPQSACPNTPEAVGIFHDAEDLQAANDDLLTQGVNRMISSIPPFLAGMDYSAPAEDVFDVTSASFARQ